MSKTAFAFKHMYGWNLQPTCSTRLSVHEGCKLYLQMVHRFPLSPVDKILWRRFRVFVLKSEHTSQNQQVRLEAPGMIVDEERTRVAWNSQSQRPKPSLEDDRSPQRPPLCDVTTSPCPAVECELQTRAHPPLVLLLASRGEAHHLLHIRSGISWSPRH